MNDFIYSLIFVTISAIGGSLVFIIFLSLRLIAFVIVALLSTLKRLYTLKNRAWFFICVLASSFLELAFLSFLEQIELFYLSLAVSTALCGVTLVLPVKKVKIKESERELARLFDEKAKTEEQSLIVKKPQIENIEKYDESSKFELDFQHVKLVLSKLEYYPLSTSDRKIIKELEDGIYQAENQGFTSLIKNKINDGLGALLKIMSKYGV